MSTLALPKKKKKPDIIGIGMYYSTEQITGHEPTSLSRYTWLFLVEATENKAMEARELTQV